MATSIEVKPTATVTDSKQYSDIALTSLFNAHVSIINSERQVIWLRYQSMLIANSIVFAFLAKAPPPEFPAVLFSLTFLIFGWVLCAAWLVTTRSGYRLFFNLHQASLSFTWPELDSSANPSVAGERYRQEGDWIRRTAYSVIYLFAVGYFVLFMIYTWLK